MIVYACENGHLVKKFIRQASQAPVSFICVTCKCDMKKQLRAPNSQSVITVDNGVQAKAVEVNLELVEAIKDQSTKDFTTKE